MGTGTRALVAAAFLALLIAVATWLVTKGVYGWALFVAVPACAGGLASWTFRPKTSGEAVEVGALTGFIGSFLFLVVGLEGIVCVVMALIPAIGLSIVGSVIVYRSSAIGGDRTAAMVLLLPVSFWFDTHAKPPVYTVQTSIIVNASPEHVWKYAVAFPDITGARDWVLRTGVAYPIRTRIVGTGVGASRFCDLSTGPVVEKIVDWNPPHRLRFRVVSTPPAMQERGLYGPVSPKHLTGYYVSKQGEFTLTPLSGGRTLLQGTSWYQHGLWPAEYWRWWSDTIVHHIHVRVLEHIRALSESER